MYEVIHDGKDRASWLAARKQGIGGSDAPVVLGLSPWRSPLDLYVEKISDTVEDGIGPQAGWGHLLEPLILERFGQLTGRAVRRDGALIRSLTRDWQLATLDGIQCEGSQAQGLVEIKAASLQDEWSDGPPNHVVCQVQHQLAVTGLPYGSVAVMFTPKFLRHWDIQHWDIPRDEDFIARLIEAEEAFWWRVVTRDPPPAESGDKSAIAKLFPKVVEAQPVELGEEFAQLDMRLIASKKVRDEADNAIKAMENQIRMAIGDHAGGRLSSGIVYTLKESTRAEYVVPASTFRTLRRVKGK